MITLQIYATAMLWPESDNTLSEVDSGLSLASVNNKHTTYVSL